LNATLEFFDGFPGKKINGTKKGEIIWLEDIDELLRLIGDKWQKSSFAAS